MNFYPEFDKYKKITLEDIARIIQQNGDTYGEGLIFRAQIDYTDRKREDYKIREIVGYCMKLYHEEVSVEGYLLTRNHEANDLLKQLSDSKEVVTIKGSIDTENRNFIIIEDISRTLLVNK